MMVYMRRWHSFAVYRLYIATRIVLVNRCKTGLIEHGFHPDYSAACTIAQHVVHEKYLFD